MACIISCFFIRCFLGTEGVLYGAFLAPIMLVIVFNVIIFIVILTVLFKHTKKKYKRTKSKRVIVRFLTSIFGLIILYGFPWIFALFFVSRERDENFTLQLIFTVVNSLQGFFIFIFFCVIGKDSREAWRELLHRGRVRRKSTIESCSHDDKNDPARWSSQTSSTLVGQANSSTLTHQYRSSRRIDSQAHCNEKNINEVYVNENLEDSDTNMEHTVSTSAAVGDDGRVLSTSENEDLQASSGNILLKEINAEIDPKVIHNPFSQI